MPTTRRVLRWLGAASLAALAGCAAVRSVHITSEPSGAEVRLDGEVVGRTPLAYPFEHYGTRRLTLTLDGYRTSSELIKLRTPWHARFPIDVLTEAVLPLGLHDHPSVHVVLTSGVDPGALPDLRSVLDRAEALRRAGPSGPTKLPPVRARELTSGAPAQTSGAAPQPPGDSNRTP